MKKNVKKIVLVLVIILAVLAALFIILMLLPDDEKEEEYTAEIQETVTAEEETQPEEPQEEETEPEEPQEEETEPEGSQAEAEPGVTRAAEEQPEETVTVDIPASELSEKTLSFRTVALDNSEVTDDIFSGHDITVVHIWGTFCGPCIAEMDSYAALYRDLPDNVNLVGLVCDVYEGSDTNVSDAEEILGDAGAEFTNLRTGGELSGIVDGIQYVPSSFFVDRQGHIIGDMMEGAGFEETKARLEGYLK